MPSSTAALRYAKALFSLARDARVVSEVRTEIEGLSTLFGENEELRHALLTPLHPADERKSALRALAERLRQLSGAGEYSGRFPRRCSTLLILGLHPQHAEIEIHHIHAGDSLEDGDQPGAPALRSLGWDVPRRSGDPLASAPRISSPQMPDA